jgi:hypothetical protein
MNDMLERFTREIRRQEKVIRIFSNIDLYQMPKFSVHFSSECSGRKSREARLATAFPS